MIHNGKPIQIVENVTVRGKALDDDTEADVDVGGWITMPVDHWAWIKSKLEKATAGD